MNMGRPLGRWQRLIDRLSGPPANEAVLAAAIRLYSAEDISSRNISWASSRLRCFLYDEFLEK